MKIIRLGDKGDSILRQDLSYIVSDPPKMRGYHAQMAELCKRSNGLGLAANQVGVRENLFFISHKVKMPKLPNGGLVINPVIEEYMGVVYTDEEGCLSLPGERYEVMRRTRIKVKFWNTTGHMLQTELTGRAAQVFQHEYDHLKGLTLRETGRRILPHEPIKNTE